MWIPLEQLERHVEELGLPDECPYCCKLSFATEAEAKDSARHSAKTRGQHLWVYECPKGKGWHLTSRRPGNFVKPPKSPKSRKSRRHRSNRANTTL